MTSNAKYFCAYFIWLLVLTCFMAGWGVDAIRRRKENYRYLWGKVADHERRILKMEDVYRTTKMLK